MRLVLIEPCCAGPADAGRGEACGLRWQGLFRALGGFLPPGLAARRSCHGGFSFNFDFNFRFNFNFKFKFNFRFNFNFNFFSPPRFRCARAGSSAARASVAAGFAAVSQLRLVLWRIAGDGRAGYEQLSADDGHQRGAKPDKDLWMGRCFRQFQRVRA
jgi:hypothetical protein